MFIKIIHAFKHFIQMLLLATLSSLHPAVANLLDPPVITLSHTVCDKAYLVRIFENGQVEYRGGYGVKIPGMRESQISRTAIEALLKKFDVENIVSDDRENLSIKQNLYVTEVAIRLRHDNRDFTFYSHGETYKANFQRLAQEIVRATKADIWITDTKRYRCYDHRSLIINDLKMK